MVKFVFALAFTGLVAAFAAPAAAFTAINGLQVNPAAERGAFDVISRGGSGPSQIWCAAGQYARHALGVRPGARIYVSQPTARNAKLGGRKATRFTVLPNAALKAGPRPGDGGNYSASVSKAGFSLRTAHAETFCKPLWEEDFPFLFPRP